MLCHLLLTCVISEEKYTAIQIIALCNGLNICVPHPKFICWNPNPQCDVIWMQGHWEVIRSWGWHLHEWDQWPSKKRHKNACSLSPSPMHSPGKAIRGPRKKVAVCRLGTKASSGTEPCLNLGVGLPSLQNREKTDFCCLNHTVHGLLLRHSSQMH